MRFSVAVLLLIIGVAGQNLSACSCAAPPPPKAEMEWATAVCLAEVVKLEDDGQYWTVTLKVEKWWKGGESAELTVSTHKSGATCGYGFKKGSRYLVYAGAAMKDKPLPVSLCSRTSTAKEAETNGDFKELGEGKAPASSPKK
ncbi:hypothetical protein [Zavarzinella formosa]|uniref:hypothetical protein n=1 Tax=Zavarzinella formosa TaxID=360055 RepID=UPI000698748B|nr:hypothetical protein [Zavarzinella formosa]